MESFNDIYDIESPRTTERKMANIENSIHSSLLNDHETFKVYKEYSCLWISIFSIIAVGIVSCVILIVLLCLKNV